MAPPANAPAPDRRHRPTPAFLDRLAARQGAGPAAPAVRPAAATARADVAIQRGPGGPRPGRRIDWTRSRGMARLTFTHVARHFHTLGASAAHHFTHAARERTNGRRIGADARPTGGLQVTRSPTFRSRRLPTPIRLVVSAAFDPDRVGLVAGRATPRDDVLPCARRPFGGRRPDPDGDRRNTSVRSPMPRTPMAKRGRPRPATRASPVPPPSVPRRAGRPPPVMFRGQLAS